jgi:hypothetical protein
MQDPHSNQLFTACKEGVNHCVCPPGFKGDGINCQGRAAAASSKAGPFTWLLLGVSDCWARAPSVLFKVFCCHVKLPVSSAPGLRTDKLLLRVAGFGRVPKST